MPNLIAHRIFIDKLISSASLSPAEQDAIRLGTQGPDPLFYYGIVPWRGWHYIAAFKRYGNQIHRTNGTDFLARLVLQTQQIEDEEEKSIFKAFVMGQVAHLYLDRGIHPFVYYFSGFDKEGKLTGEFHHAHAYFESRADGALLELVKIEGFDGRTEELLPLNRKVTNVIDKNLTPVVKELLGAKLSKNYYTNALKNIRSMQKMTRNGFIKFVSGKKSMFNALFTPAKPSGDPLNLKKEEWYNPVTKTPSNLSFVELLDKVLSEARPFFLEYFDTGEIPDITKVTDERSYKGVEVGATLKYWKKTME